MSFALPHVHVQLTGAGAHVESMTTSAQFGESVGAELLSLDRETAARPLPGDRAVPLDGGAWAIGRGSFGGVVWRLVPPEAAKKLTHPAWIWRSSRWFDPTSAPTGPLPGTVPLRSQLTPAARLCDDPSQTIDLLASTVAGLRRPNGPIAVVVDPNTVADPAAAGRWYLLALLTILPPAVRVRLRVSSFEARPAAGAWDVVITSAPPDGYRTLRPGDGAPDTHDVPPRFILERLGADDPETLEQAAHWSDAGDSDPWGAAIRQRWVVAEPSRTLPQTRPSHERRRPPRLRLNTPEAWLSLTDRTDEERGRIVQAWLEHHAETAPTESILGAIGRVRPSGHCVMPWTEALLRWTDAGPSRVAAAKILGITLDDELLPGGVTTRAALWTEYQISLMELGQFDEALAACSGVSAQALIDAGAGQVVTEAWVRLPNNRRPEGGLRDLVGRLSDSASGQGGLIHLWQALMVQEQDAQADVVLHEIATRQGHSPRCPIDRFLQILAGSAQATRWVGHVARSASPSQLARLIDPVTSGAHDPLWEHCIDVRSQHGSPEERIADQISLPEPQVARLEHELRDLAATVRVWRFPAPLVAAGAQRLAGLEGASMIWRWLHLCASPAQDRPSGGIAALIDGLARTPPATAAERAAVWTMSEGLGMAEGWPPVQHAELLLRLGLVTGAADPNFLLDLGASLARGIGRRADAADHLARVTEQIAVLPAGHPAAQLFLKRLLPVIFAKGVTETYTRAVDTTGWPPENRSLWLRILKSLGVRR